MRCYAGGVYEKETEAEKPLPKRLILYEKLNT